MRMSYLRGLPYASSSIPLQRSGTASQKRSDIYTIRRDTCAVIRPGNASKRYAVYCSPISGRIVERELKHYLCILAQPIKAYIQRNPDAMSKASTGFYYIWGQAT